MLGVWNLGLTSSGARLSGLRGSTWGRQTRKSQSHLGEGGRAGGAPKPPGRKKGLRRQSARLEIPASRLLPRALPEVLAVRRGPPPAPHWRLARGMTFPLKPQFLRQHTRDRSGPSAETCERFSQGRGPRPVAPRRAGPTPHHQGRSGSQIPGPPGPTGTATPRRAVGSVLGEPSRISGRPLGSRAPLLGSRGFCSFLGVGVHL